MTRKPAKTGESGYERIANDNYRTPAWVTKALLDNVRGLFNSGPVWEPACGEGDMVAALRDAGLSVFGSDVRPTVDAAGLVRTSMDFLSGVGHVNRHRTIITNPPYAFAQEFIEKALDYTFDTHGIVAMLLSHEFDAPSGHRHLMQHPAFAMKLMLPRRIKWVGMEEGASPRQVHAWYLWSWPKASFAPDQAPIMRWAE